MILKSFYNLLNEIGEILMEDNIVPMLTIWMWDDYKFNWYKNIFFEIVS